jgi:hypothetical protein
VCILFFLKKKKMMIEIDVGGEGRRSCLVALLASFRHHPRWRLCANQTRALPSFLSIYLLALYFETHLKNNRKTTMTTMLLTMLIRRNGTRAVSSLSMISHTQHTNSCDGGRTHKRLKRDETKEKLGRKK